MSKSNAVIIRVNEEEAKDGELRSITYGMIAVRKKLREFDSDANRLLARFAQNSLTESTAGIFRPDWRQI